MSKRKTAEVEPAQAEPEENVVEESADGGGEEHVVPTPRPEPVPSAPTPPFGPSLVTKLARVMMAVDRVAKRGRNDFHRYDYATEADIVDAVRKELAAQSVMMLPRVDRVERIEATNEKGKKSWLTTVYLTYSFVDGESGEVWEVPWIGEGSDSLDKAAYKAMTGATKYVLLKTFLIPTGDDPEIEEKEKAGNGRATGKHPAAQRHQAKPQAQAQAKPQSNGTNGQDEARRVLVRAIQERMRELDADPTGDQEAGKRNVTLRFDDWTASKRLKQCGPLRKDGFPALTEWDLDQLSHLKTLYDEDAAGRPADDDIPF